MLRILLVPLVVALILVGGRTAAAVAAAVFVAGALTDLLDGYLARRWNVSTRTGQWLDPLADKAFVAAPVVTLAALGDFPLWAAVVLIAREVVIAGLRAWLGTRGRGMPASPLAKVKTVVQIAAITLYIVPFSASANGVRLAFLIGAVVLTVVTGAQYAARAYGWARAPRPA